MRWLELAADSSTGQTWVDVALATLNVVQTLALAYMANRSRRVRKQDKPLNRAGRHFVDGAPGP